MPYTTSLRAASSPFARLVQSPAGDVVQSGAPAVQKAPQKPFVPRGIVPALITPMTATQDVDEDGLRQLVERLIEKGVHGLFVLGTNGEFISLGEQEKVRIAEIAVDQARGRVPVIAGTGAYATREVIALTQRMQDVGVDAASVITPYFNGATQTELIAHYKAIAASCSLPIMLYTIPAKAGITLTVDSVKRLADVPTIRGIKDSGGDFDRLLQLIKLRRDDFAVLTGTDSMILWTLLAGGDGAVAATTNAVPDVVMAIWRHFLQGEVDAARFAQEALRPLRDAFAWSTMPVILKTAASILGMPAGPARAPALALDAATRDRLETALAVYKQWSVPAALTSGSASSPAPLQTMADIASDVAANLARSVA